MLVVLVVGLTVDLWTKEWAFDTLADVNMQADPVIIPWHEPQVVIPRVLNFRLVKNEGAVFGIGQDKRYFFIAFTVAAVVVGLLLFARWTAASHRLAHGAIGLILAGGLGNLYDRWTYALVRDFLHLFPDVHLPFGWKWPGGSPEIFPWVFNIADVMLLTGMLLLMIHINRLEKRKKTDGANEEDRPAPPDTEAAPDGPTNPV